MARIDKFKAGLRSLWSGLPAAELDAAAAVYGPRDDPSEVRGLSRRAWIAIGAVLAVTAAVIIGVQVQKQRAHDRQVDIYYCTLSGVGLLDRGPNTGERCIDLLDY